MDDFTLVILETTTTMALVAIVCLGLYLAIKHGVKHGILLAHYEIEKRSAVIKETNDSDKDVIDT